MIQTDDRRVARAAFAASGILAALVLFPGAACAQVQPTLTGDTRIHDPSVIALDGRFAAFGTGEQGPTRGAIRVKTSQDGVVWRDAGTIGKGVPKWGIETLGYKSDNVWAPSVSRHGDRTYLYYALSTFGLNASAIGLMTNARFDPGKTRRGLGGRGTRPEIESDARISTPSTPIASTSRTAAPFSSGARSGPGSSSARLDPVSGKLLDPNAQPIALASRNGGAVEAPSLLEHDGKFYLFVAFDQCCKGVGSTYSTRIGRADRIEGPYLDKDGRDMMQGGGSPFMVATGHVIGPGGAEPVKTDKGDMLAYHYYDGDHAGAPTLELAPLRWTTKGWPALDPFPPSSARSDRSG